MTSGGHILVLLTTLLSLVVTQDDLITEECPEQDGLYADAEQCDLYYECKNRQVTAKLCPDGLVFNEFNPDHDKCTYPFATDCSERPKLQAANGNQECPRQNGYYVPLNPKDCSEYINCVDGVAFKFECPSGLVWDADKGNCDHPDKVNRPDCSSEDIFGFSCSKQVKDPKEHEHPRFPDPTDCEFFYICINGVEARRNKCEVRTVFNALKETCSSQRELEDTDPCHNHFEESLLESVDASGDFGTGIKLDTRKRVRTKVIRRKQRPSSGPDSPFRAGVGGGVEAPLRRRVRPNLPDFRLPTDAVAPQPSPAAGSPPSFVLSDQEAIQKFRNSNRLAPQNGGRLTFLSPEQFQRPLSPPGGFEEDPSTFNSQDFGFGQRSRQPTPN